MNFTKKQIEILNTIRDNHEKIRVSGINSLGDPFTTTCYIDNEEHKSILSCYIPVNFGQKVFKTNLATDHQFMQVDSNALTIDLIETLNGDLIYKNKDIEKYKEEALQLKESYESEVSKYGLGLVVTEDDCVTKNLRQLIGHPVILAEDCVETSKLRNHQGKPIKIASKGGVLTAIGCATHGGSVFVALSNGKTNQITYVGRNTKLYSVNTNKEVKLIAENKFNPETTLIFDRREQTMKDARASKFEINQVSSRKLELVFESDRDNELNNEE